MSRFFISDCILLGLRHLSFVSKRFLHKDATNRWGDLSCPTIPYGRDLGSVVAQTILVQYKGEFGLRGPSFADFSNHSDASFVSLVVVILVDDEARKVG